MGQKIAKSQKDEKPSAEILLKSINDLFGVDPQTLTLQNIMSSLLTISRNLSQEGSFIKNQQGFFANQILLKCLYHKQFEVVMQKLMVLLVNELSGILHSKLIALIPREKFRKCLNLANFCIYFIDENLIQTVNLLNIRSDLHPASRELIKQLTKDVPQVSQQPLSTLGSQQLTQFCKTLRLSLNLFIDLHLKVLTRSDFTLKIIDRLNQSVFILYCKLYFSTVRDLSKRQKMQNLKPLTRIGAYFIGLGLQYKIPSIYQSGVLLLVNLLSDNKAQGKALPSHLFKSLPIISNNDMLHWLVCALLFSLRYIKEQNKYFCRLNSNRIPTLKLLESIFKKQTPISSQITFMLQQLCLQTKPGQIQRVYISSLADSYSKFQGMDSQIIRKYSQVKEINYNVRSSNRSLRIKPEDVMTELDNDDEYMAKQMMSLCAKYIVQVIFQKNDVIYQYSDKSLWNLILSGLEESSNNSGNLGGQMESEMVEE